MKLNNLTCICLSALIAFTISLDAQEKELEKAYLESLPESVREDVLKEIKDQKSKDGEEIYRRPSTSLNKYETVQKWEKFIKESQVEPSQRFGAQIFQSMQSSFMPINEPNFDSTYILDYGDVLEIQLVGQKSKKYKLEVERDGSINIPDLSKIIISGLSLDQAGKVINARVQSYYLGTEAFTTIKEIRDIQILVTGEAVFPGIYTLSGNTNLLHALNVAGGITDDGSYREVDIRRDGQLLYSVDLYDILIYGDIPFMQSLRSGDTVLVKNAKKIIRVSGAGINRPAKYELADQESLQDLVNFANGFSYESSLEDLIYEKRNGGKISSSQIKKLELTSIIPESGSSLYAPFNNYREIEITGQVKRPGNYVIGEDETLSGVIKRAGGYKEKAYPFGSLLIRESIKKRDKEINAKLYKTLINSLILGPQVQQVGATGTQIPLLLEELKDLKPSGRMQAEFNLLKISANPILDVVLEDKDKIHIPIMNRVVFVYGEVTNPGPRTFKSGEPADYYISKSGNLSFYADKKYSIVVSPDGSASPLDKSLIDRSDVVIYPGSVIFIPRKYGKVDRLRMSSILAPIFSSFALSLASVSALQE